MLHSGRNEGLHSLGRITFGCDLSIAINQIKQRCSSQIEKPRNRSIT